jgi:tetratricopeptide (TPR) repeat protein
MKLLEGIQLHELVLIILGFILGLVLIFVFLFGALRGKTNLKLLYGFIAPVVMIGYPSIQSIEFSKDVIKIDKLVEEVNRNPMDTVATRALLNEISTLPKSRCVTSSDAMNAIANAQAAVGLYDSAKVTIQKAVALDPQSSKVQQSKKGIEQKWMQQKVFETKVGALKNNLEQLNANPKNMKLRDSVAIKLEEIKQLNTPVHLAQRDALAVGLAAAIVGEKQAAEQVADDVLQVSPNQPDAKRLKDAIRDKVIEKRFPARVRQQTPSKPKPNGRNGNGTVEMQLPPVVESPAAIKIDTNWRSKIIPKSTVIAKDFVKWDKEQ